MSAEHTIEVTEVSDTAIVAATANGVILATAEKTLDAWHVHLCGEDLYKLPDRETVVAALKTLVPCPFPALQQDLCADDTCCLACEHGGGHHSAGECWAAGEDATGADQCSCSWYHPALTTHRHIAPIGAAL